MTIGTVTHPAAGAPADATPDDPRTWDCLSCEELKEIVGRGVQGGDLFYGASRELQRRATLATNAAEEAEATAVHARLISQKSFLRRLYLRYYDDYETAVARAAPRRQCIAVVR